MDTDEVRNRVSAETLRVATMSNISIILALTAWSIYVVVGRVCTPMIRSRSTTGLGLGTGSERFPSELFFSASLTNIQSPA